MNISILSDVAHMTANTGAVAVFPSDSDDVIIVATPDDIATVSANAEAAMASVAPFALADLKYPDAVLDSFPDGAELAAIRVMMPF